MKKMNPQWEEGPNPLARDPAIVPETAGAETAADKQELLRNVTNALKSPKCKDLITSGMQKKTAVITTTVIALSASLVAASHLLCSAECLQIGLVCSALS